MPKSRPQFGLPQMQNRAKQTTAKGKQKGSNAVRRAVNRQIPALKRIANGSHTLRGAWEESGGDPLQWRIAHDSGETIYSGVCEIDQTGVVGLIFGQCSVECQRRSWGALAHKAGCSQFRRRKRRTCDVCGVQGNEDEPPFPVCGGCDARRYCGEACQIADWEAGHARKCQMSADWQEILDALADDEVY
jgi:hypothetical protein